MSKKKSLGHNPLAYSNFGASSFDFISGEAEKTEEPSKPEKKPNKSVVSYYLEDPLVEKIRKIADEQGTSYSSLVNKLLKHQLSKSS